MEQFCRWLLRNTRKTDAVSNAPPEGLACSFPSGGAQPRPLRSLVLWYIRETSTRVEPKTTQLVAGVDLGGNAINYTFINGQERFLLEDLCEHPERSRVVPEL